MNISIKYPRTYHFPFSLGLQNDDRMIEDESCFEGKTVAVTIKMDGENTSLYEHGLHARSLSSVHHGSRSWIKGLHSTIKNQIPEGWRICGENMYAKHSIFYNDLESFFYVFNIWNEYNNCISLDLTLNKCKELNLIHVPIIDVFKFDGFEKIEKLYHEVVNMGHEGIVVRNIELFNYSDFKSHVVKAVRKNHITTDEHWMTNWVPNKLKKHI